MWAGSVSMLTLNSSMDETRGYGYKINTRNFFFSLDKYYLFAKCSPARFRGLWPKWTGLPPGPWRTLIEAGAGTAHFWHASNIITSKLAGRESGCEGSSWQIWRHASPAAANTPNYCTPQILPLVAPLGPLPSAVSVTRSRALHTQQSELPQTGAWEGPKRSLMGGWHSWLWICTAC